MKETILLKIAWMLPRSLVYWCAARVAAYAIARSHAEGVVNAHGVVTAMDALERWATDR